MANEFIARNGIVSKSNLIVSGSLTALSTITAQTLVVQTITSSISSITGSTNFGSIIGNSHTFTGSMSVSGSADIVDQLRIGGSTVISYDVGAETTRLGVGYAPQTYTKAIIIDNSTGHGLMVRQNNGAGKIVEFSGPEGALGLMVSGSGRVGIGTSNPTSSLHIYSAATSASQAQLVISNPTSNTNDAAGIRFNANTAGSQWDVKFQTVKGIDWFQMTNDAGTSVKHSWNDTKYYPGASSLGASRTGYISGDGTNIGIGITNPSYNLHVNGTAQINSVKFLNGTSYNENIRCYPSVNDWSSIILGSISGDSGAGGGQWSLLRWPTSTYSNQFSIRHSGSDTIIINTSGQITTPSQPAFYAWLESGTTTTTGNYAGFNTTRLNRGGHYNTSTGRFTAPITGVYRFLFAALYRQQSGTGPAEISISVNGSNINSRGLAYANVAVTNAHIPCIVELIISLNANDYVMPFIYSVGANSDWYMGNNLSYFCGYLLG